jgi:hypothetical protein
MLHCDLIPEYESDGELIEPHLHSIARSGTARDSTTIFALPSVPILREEADDDE